MQSSNLVKKAFKPPTFVAPSKQSDAGATGQKLNGGDKPLDKSPNPSVSGHKDNSKSSNVKKPSNTDVSSGSKLKLPDLKRKTDNDTSPAAGASCSKKPFVSLSEEQYDDLFNAVIERSLRSCVDVNMTESGANQDDGQDLNMDEIEMNADKKDKSIGVDKMYDSDNSIVIASSQNNSCVVESESENESLPMATSTAIKKKMQTELSRTSLMSIRKALTYAKPWGSHAYDPEAHESSFDESDLEVFDKSTDASVLKPANKSHEEVEVSSELISTNVVEKEVLSNVADKKTEMSKVSTKILKTKKSQKIDKEKVLEAKMLLMELESTKNSNDKSSCSEGNDNDGISNIDDATTSSSVSTNVVMQVDDSIINPLHGFRQGTDSTENPEWEKLKKKFLRPKPSFKNRKEFLKWLRNQRYKVATFVQCCNEDCKSWRYVEHLEDPEDLRSDWYCRMNTDPDYNTCGVNVLAEVPCSLEDDDFDIIDNIYPAGSVVWAKLPGYPWWPGIVDDDPNCEVFYWISEDNLQKPTYFHVTFFGEPISRSWIETESLKRFDKNLTLGNEFQYKSVELKNSIRDAKEALGMTNKERLENYGFIARYKGVIRPPLNLSDSEDENNNAVIGNVNVMKKTEKLIKKKSVNESRKKNVKKLNKKKNTNEQTKESVKNPRKKTGKNKEPTFSYLSEIKTTDYGSGQIKPRLVARPCLRTYSSTSDETSCIEQETDNPSCASSSDVNLSGKETSCPVNLLEERSENSVIQVVNNSVSDESDDSEERNTMVTHKNDRILEKDCDLIDDILIAEIEEFDKILSQGVINIIDV